MTLDGPYETFRPFLSIKSSILKRHKKAISPVKDQKENVLFQI